MPAQSIQACAPTEEWNHGRCDAILLMHPAGGAQEGAVKGLNVGQLRCIFQPITYQGDNEPILIYFQYFDGVRVGPSLTADTVQPDNKMHVVCRCVRSDGSFMGDVTF